jgi:GNAT superfamily N-acetyltransferase
MRADTPTLASILDAAARGHWPPSNGGLVVLPPPSPTHHHAVLAFTGHHVVVTDADPAWVHARLPSGDLSAPLNPPFLTALSERSGRRTNNIDLVAMARRLPGPPPVALSPAARSEHPRVRRAERYRDGVRAWTAGGGILILGKGVAGRWEAAVEVDEPARGQGLGRALALAARHLVPDGDTVWAQIAPGNAASIRAFLAAGYIPIGAEALLVPAS